MSREIKFRLRKYGQIVGYEMWFEGDGLAKPRWIYAYPDGQFNLGNPYIEHDDKDEFTGLKDKNGKKIFEGDIVRFYSINSRGYKVKNHISVIEYRQSQITGFNIGAGNSKNREVIGNIYENPELILPAKDAA